MSIAVIFSRLVVLVIGPRRRQFFKPFAYILYQSTLMIVHINSRRDMHRTDKTEPVLNTAPFHNLLHLLRDVHHLPALPRLKRQIFGIALHLRSRHRDSPWTTFRVTFMLKSVVTEKRAIAEELSHRGLNLLASGDAAGAIEQFRAALGSDSEYFEAHHGLIRALRDAGRLEQSISAALALTALTPDDPLAHTALSISLQQAGHVPEAEAAAARARIVEWRTQLRSTPEQEP